MHKDRSYFFLIGRLPCLTKPLQDNLGVGLEISDILSRIVTGRREKEKKKKEKREISTANRMQCNVAGGHSIRR